MTKEYKNWLQQLKSRIRSSQIKASVKVNAELIDLYWHLGKEIIAKEKGANWGSGFLNELSKDLKLEFPDIKGFSLTNLKYVRLWVNFYLPVISQQPVDQLKNQILQQPVAPIKILPKLAGQTGQQAVDQMPSLFATVPWGHHLQIITKCKNIDEALFYMARTAEHGWSRNVLVHQMEEAYTNERVLPSPIFTQHFQSLKAISQKNF